MGEKMGDVIPIPLEVSMDEDGCRSFLTESKWPKGLQDCCVKTMARVPYRIFICDDSGSMMKSDGKRIARAENEKKLVGCTRWAELTEGLKFHVNLAKAARAPCEFRLLNSASPILIGTGDADEDARYSRIMNALHQSPSGGTPLVKHIKEIVLEIRSVAEQLSVKGQKVVLIIASDGQSSDGDVVQAMRPLKDLPVSVVVRLCTDEESVVSYWNDIDRDLELELDVLDDLVGEAEEVHRFSPWITYGEPLHRMREFGCANREVDLLDEDVLSMDQLMQFVVLIFGVRASDVPHPEVDWLGFINFVNQENNRIGMEWNPLKQQDRHWIQTKKLGKAYGKSGCIVM